VIVLLISLSIIIICIIILHKPLYFANIITLSWLDLIKYVAMGRAFE